MTQDNASPTSGDSSIESLFEVTMRGYNKRQVEDYVAWLQNEVRSAQEEAKTSQLQVQDHARDKQRAVEELAQLRSSATAARPAHEEVSERLGQILRLADEEADQKRAKAAEEADTTLEAAREQASKVLDAARSAAEGIISAARERADKEAAAAKAEAEHLLESASTSSQATLHDAQQRAAYVLADADRRSSAITSLQDERLAGLRDVHTDTLRRLEAVRGVLEKVLTAEADAGPPDSGIAPAALPLAGSAIRPEEVAIAGEAQPVHDAFTDGVPTAADYAQDEVAEPLLSDEYVDGILDEDPLGLGETETAEDGEVEANELVEEGHHVVAHDVADEAEHVVEAGEQSVSMGRG